MRTKERLHAAVEEHMRFVARSHDRVRSNKSEISVIPVWFNDINRISVTISVPKSAQVSIIMRSAKTDSFPFVMQMDSPS